jgi:hypothetical protein
MVKKMVNKKNKNNNIFKSLIIILILAIALVSGVKLVQKNQENRSKAYSAYEDGGSLYTPVYFVGKVSNYNSAECKAVGGKCTIFNKIYSEGLYCKATSFWRDYYGKIRVGLCNNDPSLNVMCCVPVK